MYNNMYGFSSVPSVDRIDAQINELKKMKEQMQKPMQPPTSLTQNFQLAPTTRESLKYAESIDEVQNDIAVGDIPYFSKDMSVLWLKNSKGVIKTYELNEIIPKDEKDLQIEFLQAQIDELKKVKVNESNDEYIDEPIKDEKSTSVQSISRNKKR